MNIFIDNLEPVFRQFLYLILIIFFMAFLVRPLLNYFAVNREIEHKKRLIKQLRDSALPPDTEDLSESLDQSSGAAGNKLPGMAASSPGRTGDVVPKTLHND
ncbi:MAG: hypothetical protein GXP59_03145 [Deltaproteobacteria bacterium]|nr:hypothetical protein [Deltaproteobacteria bacterium]